jgi:hypothetical protein
MDMPNLPQVEASEPASLQSSRENPVTTAIKYTPDSSVKHPATPTKDNSLSPMLKSSPTTDTPDSTTLAANSEEAESEEEASPKQEASGSEHESEESK